MKRRHFILGTALTSTAFGSSAAGGGLDLVAIGRTRILKAADRYLGEAPITISAFEAPHSPGSRHDYYSEADSWWPDPGNPKGPYIRKDGYSNPDKFTAHREAVIRLGVQLPALAAAYRVTGQARYAEHAEKHLRAWFVAPETRMNPNLEHAQAIIGINAGRGVGVIDTLHLVEVARAVSVLRAARGRAAIYAPTVAWFEAYLTWMTTSPNGVEERDQKNNHVTCWALQAGEFARLTGRQAELDVARERIKALVPRQIAVDGAQPLELARTKPYGHCLFNLDVLAASAHVLSTPSETLWTWKGVTGGSIADALAYMGPFIADKRRWLRPQDVEAWADPADPEIIRNYPLRQPVLWVDA